jgi:RES domain-containing protein
MRSIYRLTKARYADSAFSGEGSLRQDGRWHRRGVRLAYASDTEHPRFEELAVEGPTPFEIDPRLS